MNLIDWITNSPPAVTALTVAFISASVALLVAAVTQIALSRRAKRDLLTKKLEEFYLLLNEVSSESLNRYMEIRKSYFEPERTKSEDFWMQYVKGLDVQKKVVMYARLYFPQLSTAYEALSVAQSRLHELEKKRLTDAPPAVEEFMKAYSQYIDCLGVLENMIVSNKALLTGSFRRLRKHPPPSNNGMHPTADTAALK